MTAPMEVGHALGSLRKRVVSSLYSTPPKPALNDEPAGPSMWAPTAERGFLPSVVPGRSDFLVDAEGLMEELQQGLLHRTHTIRQRCRALPLPRIADRLSELKSRGAAGAAPAAAAAAAAADELAERAMVVYSFLSQCYLHTPTAETSASALAQKELPPSLAVPWVEAAVHCGRRPGLDYAACVLSNLEWVSDEREARGSGGAAPAAALVSWRGGGQAVSTPRALCSATGLEDEHWFYEVHGLVERAAAPAVGALGRGLAAASASDADELASSLNDIESSLRAMAALMPRMSERCNPDVFHRAIRGFLAGVETPVRLRGVHEGAGVLSDLRRPGGWRTPRADDISVQLQGASGAQSALIPCVDAFLGISHRGAAELPEYKVREMERVDVQRDEAPAGRGGGTSPLVMVAPPPRPSAASLLAVGSATPCPLPHLPPPHRALLLQLEHASPASSRTVSAIADRARPRDAERLRRARDGCVRALAEWRKAHMALVRQFILRPAADKGKEEAAVTETETEEANNLPRIALGGTSHGGGDSLRDSQARDSQARDSLARDPQARDPQATHPATANVGAALPSVSDSPPPPDSPTDDESLQGTGGTRLIEFLAGRLLDTVRSYSSSSYSQSSEAHPSSPRLSRSETYSGGALSRIESAPDSSTSRARDTTGTVESMEGAKLPRRGRSVSGGLARLGSEKLAAPHAEKLARMGGSPFSSGGSPPGARHAEESDFQKMVGSSDSLAWTLQQVKRVEQLKRRQRVLLRYEKKDAYMNGMEDILASPDLHMADEFSRPLAWTDWRGVRYTLGAEWDYVNGEAARKDGCTPGVRDENNAGKTPLDFVYEVNAWIAQRRFWQRGGVRLRLKVGAAQGGGLRWGARVASRVAAASRVGLPRVALAR